jgi:hypothetical protein
VNVNAVCQFDTRLFEGRLIKVYYLKGTTPPKKNAWDEWVEAKYPTVPK